jgi:hypothetical protein
MSSTEVCQGWYSAKAAFMYGSSIYLTAEGGQVEVTNVGSGTNYKWEDKVMVGYVTDWWKDCQSGYNGLQII